MVCSFYFAAMRMHMQQYWSNIQAATTACKPQGSSQRGSPMSELCSIHHDFAAMLCIPGVCVQWSESGHNAGKHSVVLRTRYGIMWSWYGQFNVELSQPPKLSSGTAIFGWPWCWFLEMQISTMYRYTPLGLSFLSNLGVDQWLQICFPNSCQWVYVMVKGVLC